MVELQQAALVSDDRVRMRTPWRQLHGYGAAAEFCKGLFLLDGSGKDV